MEHATKVRQLKHELGQIKRQLRRAQPTRTRCARPSQRCVLVCTIIACLSGDDRLAQTWGCMDQRRRKCSFSNSLAPVSATDVAQWRMQFSDHARVIDALHDLGHPLRQEADYFLMEKMVVEALRRQNQKNIAVPTSWMLTTYMRLWRHRPRCIDTEELLTRLETQATYQKKWAWNFRRRWRLRWGISREINSLPKATQRQRAEIFIRWARWLLEQAPSGRRVVVLNMDETTISSAKHNSRGTWTQPGEQPDADAEPTCKLRGFPRCALIACVTDDDQLQSFLPQIFLPRTPTTGVPSPRVRRVFSEAGTPIEAWHGSAGWNVKHTMRAWLRAVVGTTKHHRPGCCIILIMDTYSVHASVETLDLCRCLGIMVLLVPSGMTWLLQPCDTYVFAMLKRRMRTSMLEKRLCAAGGGLSWSDVLEAACTAVREVLVRKTWATAVARAGVSGDAADMAAKLQTLLHGSDLTARPPSLEELATTVGRQGPLTTKLHARLLQRVWTARGSSSSSSGAASHDHQQAPHGAPNSQVREGSTGDITAASVNRDPPGGNRLWLPRGRRLFFPARQNVVLVPENEDPCTRVNTRSQKRPLWPGLLDRDSQRRKR